jgi:hypothetical protein
MRRAGGAAAGLAALALWCGTVARAQDFAPVVPAPIERGAGALLEHGLAPATAATLADAGAARWFGLDGLVTRSLALAAGRGPVRIAGGLAQTGEPDLGWNAVGAALGVARAPGGFALRAVARRDRTVEPGGAAAAHLEERASIEAGWGVWLEAARGLRIWASVPQAWERGVAPPLERPMTLGAALARGELALWVARTAPAFAGGAGHEAGARLASGPLTAWAAARDGPLRAGCGLAARVGRLRVAGAVESHPVLGETVRLGVGLAERR